MAATSYEQGLGQGLEKGGVQGQRRRLAVQLEERFGSLSTESRKRLEQWSKDRLTELGREILRAQSLSELGLEDESP